MTKTITANKSNGNNSRIVRMAMASDKKRAQRRENERSIIETTKATVEMNITLRWLREQNEAVRLASLTECDRVLEEIKSDHISAYSLLGLV
jgi:hypothetical protein